MTLDASQIRAARALLDWTIEDLAKITGLNKDSIKNAERRYTQPRSKTMQIIRSAFEQAGIEFLPGSGLRLQNEIAQVLEGIDGIEQFLDDVYSTMRRIGGEIMVSGVDEKQFIKDRSPESIQNHRQRMESLKNISFKVLISESDPNPAAERYIEYRMIPAAMFASVPFYLYGSKLGIIIWGNPTKIILHRQEDLAVAFRKQFELVWSIAKSAKK